MVSMNGKKWNIGVGNINLKKPNLFLFLNFFVVFISLKVGSSLSFLDFLGIFSYKYERYKYRYIKYEQRSFSLTTQIHWSPKYQKIPKVSRNSKTKIYCKRFFFDATPHFTCIYVGVFFSMAKRHFWLYWASKWWIIFCTEITKDLFGEIPISIAYQISELLSVKVGALFLQENLC